LALTGDPKERVVDFRQRKEERDPSLRGKNSEEFGSGPLQRKSLDQKRAFEIPILLNGVRQIY
jgi:hypothetical protein